MVLTTNYVVSGISDSFKRRKTEFEVSPFFSYSNTPYNNYGHELFVEWDDNEWQKFFNTMAECTQLYLANGIIEAPTINLELKRLIQNSEYEFVEWAKENIDLNKEYDAKLLKASFCDEYEDFFALGQREFNNWLKEYGIAHNQEMESRKSNGKMMINFGQSEKIKAAIAKYNK